MGGLDYETTEQSVGTYFETWGPLAECCIKRFPDGRSRGFAFVTFCSLAALEQCLATPGHMIDNKKVDLRRAASGKEEDLEVLRAKAYNPEADELKKLYVGNIDTDTSEEQVRDYFLQYGNINEISLATTPDGVSKGFAHITFDTAGSVDGVQENRPHSLNDRKLETKRATPQHLIGKPEENISTNKAFIGPPEQRGKGHSGLSEDITDDDLKGRKFEIILSSIECPYFT